MGIMEKKMESTIYYNRIYILGRIWGIWGSYYNIPRAIFYLLKGDYNRMVLLPAHPSRPRLIVSVETP